MNFILYECITKTESEIFLKSLDYFISNDIIRMLLKDTFFYRHVFNSLINFLNLIVPVYAILELQLTVTQEGIPIQYSSTNYATIYIK